ncbi:methylenetetrahydrofolate reductase [NAD(P)H] [Sinanaerobacter chloroacetimidivorans]|jgi:methylenetetrahydrofolate reductase (NADPH)|uniref:Methylenetetrahydrofolate reductase n=1 Tax=Sinanaerobacter chloroacetimidivorans TaxID=2818044 RepID=A0A8J8B5K1_9FIRM|nr:methylenetetrahydrofolate reductase [NAD(P)H] [Sinanaerobacter chloroacetimidivorans]MBR0600415.1 methylenetetrahydrofolate reductase [NAD(P)H] [Sinanaerobacter chloroacetimidivorans]
MKIKDIFETKKTVISLEVFPPKIDSPVETIFKTLDQLKDINPDFISVTYGAGGKAKDRTVEIASKIKNEYHIESLAHLTCISATKKQIKESFEEMRVNNIENILAMRGDIPEDPDFDFPNPLQYEHASDLIKEVKAEGDFSIGAACYPEGHVDCESKVKDVKYLKQKVEMGAEFLITQLFFDNELFYRFMDEIDLAGINLPVSAGILPVLNKNQIIRITKLAGCAIPPKFQRILNRYEDNPEALKEAGEAYAIEQIIDLMAWGVRGIHLYTMNKPDTAKRIIGNIENIRKLQG